jgi:hypothetical protein
MHRGPHATPITLTDDERMKRDDWSRRPTSAQRLALRARVVLAAAAGRPNTAIATDLRVTLPTVRKWRDRFAAARREGLAEQAAEVQGREEAAARALLAEAELPRAGEMVVLDCGRLRACE